MSIGQNEEFDINNGAAYGNHLDLYCKDNSIKEILNVPAHFSQMGDEMHELLNLQSCKKPADVVHWEASNKIAQHLRPAPSVLAERYSFRQRRQRTDENITKYVAELTHFSKNCKFENGLLENLRDQFVCGILSDVIRQRLLSEGDHLSFADAVRIACSLEAAECEASESRTVAEAVFTGSAVRRGYKGSRAGFTRFDRGNCDVAIKKLGQTRTTVCKGCGGTHNYENCKVQGFVCGRCKRMGHLRRVCMAWSDSKDARSTSWTERQHVGSREVGFRNANSKDDRKE